MSDRAFWLALGLGRLLLEPRDVERVLLPTLADAHHELGPRPSRRERLGLLLRVVAIALVAGGGRIRDAVRETTWWPLVTAVLAGIAGALGLAAAAATLLVPVAGWISALRRHDGGRTLADDRRAATAVGLLSLAALPLLLTEGAIPWLSFGGSTLFAAFVWVALGLRLRREAQGQSGHGPERIVTA